MLDFYRGLDPKEKVLVWAVAVAVVIVIFGAGGDNAGFVAGAQVMAATGTLALAGLAFAQVKELRETRIAQERPHVIVDADYYPDSRVNVVVRNIGKGAAKKITFSFSAPMVVSSNRGRIDSRPLNESAYFKDGLDFLAPGAEIVNF